MKAVAEHGPAPAEDAVHRARDACANRLHAVRELAPVRSLDDRVHVVALDRVVNEAEATALGTSAERALQLTNEAERLEAAPDLQRDVARMAGVECGTPAMSVAADGAGLPPRAGALTTPPRRMAEIERELSRSMCHRMR